MQHENLFKYVSRFLCGKNPNIKNSEILNHFKKEGIARNTIYDNLKRLETGQSFSDKNPPGHPTSWIRGKKAKLKRLVNNRKRVRENWVLNSV